MKNETYILAKIDFTAEAGDENAASGIYNAISEASGFMNYDGEMPNKALFTEVVKFNEIVEKDFIISYSEVFGVFTHKHDIKHIENVLSKKCDFVFPDAKETGYFWYDEYDANEKLQLIIDTQNQNRAQVALAWIENGMNYRDAEGIKARFGNDNFIVFDDLSVIVSADNCPEIFGDYREAISEYSEAWAEGSDEEGYTAFCEYMRD